MDKRTVYGYWSQDLDGYGDRFVCGRTVKCRNTAQCALLERCEEKVLVDPASFAKLEADAARVPELEQIIAKKDEALDMAKCVLLETCEECTDERFDGNACHKDATCSIWSEINDIDQSLSLTPASVAKEVEDARVGRAAIALRDKWRDRIKGDKPTTRKEEAMWRELVATIAEVIAKAREATPHA